MTERENQQPTMVIDLLKEIDEAIAKIKKEQGNGYEGCIFRGEPQRFDKISSGLYRRPKTILVKQVREGLNELLAEYRQRDDEEMLMYDLVLTKMESNMESKDSATVRYSESTLKALQRYYANQVRHWVGSSRKDTVILADLQHYGGKTNLIDFSESYLVGLFFACYGSSRKDGYLIIFPKQGVKEVFIDEFHSQGQRFITRPFSDNRRALVQHSVMLHEPKGYLEYTDERLAIIKIPLGIKDEVLDYLDEYCNISEKTMFPDIQGYIRAQELDQRKWFKLEDDFVQVNRLLGEDKYNEVIKFATRKIEGGNDA